jgi:hypothetical protein
VNAREQTDRDTGQGETRLKLRSVQSEGASEGACEGACAGEREREMALTKADLYAPTTPQCACSRLLTQRKSKYVFIHG